MDTPEGSMVHGPKATLQQLPSVDRLIRAPANAALLRAHGATFVTQVARALLQHTREALCASQAPPPATDEAALSAALAARCQARLAPASRPC